MGNQEKTDHRAGKRREQDRQQHPPPTEKGSDHGRAASKKSLGSTPYGIARKQDQDTVPARSNSKDNLFMVKRRV